MWSDRVRNMRRLGKPAVEESLQLFRDKKVPIFWVFGPPRCGKATLVRQLAECTNYRLIRVYSAQNDLLCAQTKPTSENIIEYIRREILETYKHVQGYIIEDFPRNMKEALIFERRIAKVTTAIYLNLPLDAILGRTLSCEPVIDLNEVRIEHVITTKRARRVYKWLCRRNCAINVTSHYPSDETLKKCLELLENEFGYKFTLPNKFLRH